MRQMSSHFLCNKCLPIRGGGVKFSALYSALYDSMWKCFTKSDEEKKMDLHDYGAATYMTTGSGRPWSV